MGDELSRWLVKTALFVTAAWLAVALFLPAIYQGLGWLAALKAPLHGYFGSTTTLGETGDFLAGWLTPLALMWFVITVFLQKHELTLQRLEFKALRGEYEGSRKAAQEQAEQLEWSNNVRERQLFREVINDNIDMCRRRCEHIANAYNALCIETASGGKIDHDDHLKGRIFGLLENLVRTDANNGISIHRIVEMRTGQRKNQQLLNLLNELAKVHDTLERRAKTVGSEDDFHAFCSSRIAGEIMVLAKQLVAKVDRLA